MAGFRLSELNCDVWSGDLVCYFLEELSANQLPKNVTFWCNHYEEGYEYGELYQILEYTSPVLEELVIISPEGSADTDKPSKRY